MAGINFRYRKTKEQIDSSYALWEGGRLGDLSTWLVGDVVGVCFAEVEHIKRAISSTCPSDFEWFRTDGDFLNIPCEVVSRSHSIIWRDVGKFEELVTCSVTLEAATDYWEDVLLWITIGKTPEWVSD